MFDAWLDTAMRHRGSFLGFFWNVVPTFFFIILVGSIFQRVMQEGVSFFLYLSAGMMVWLPVQAVLTNAGDCYSSNKSFILVGSIKLIVFNLKSVFSAFIGLFFGFLNVLIFFLIFLPPVNFDIIYSLIGLIVLFSLLFPLSVTLALLGARYRDFSEGFRSFVRVLFLSTPVIWSVTNENRFEQVQIFLYVNPFFFALELIRSPILGLPINHAYWLPLIGYTIGAWVIAIISYRMFSKKTTLWLK